MSRINLVICAFLSAVCFATASFGAQRNIVVFVTDDLSPDLGCYGNDVIETPNIDQLAQESTLFEHAYATTASCSASRSVILTGLHNHSNGQFGHLHNYHKFSAQPWVQSLPVLLRRQGYHTACVGKFHVGPKSVFDFDEELKTTQRTPEIMADNCQAFLKAQAKAGEPFFLYFATSDPHRSGNIATDLPGQPNRFGNSIAENAGLDGVEYEPSQVIVPSFLPDTPECRAELAQYYQSVSRVDRGVGRLINILKTTGHWDNTLFVFTSDHGMAFPGAKTSVYELGLRIPLLVRYPEQKLQQTVRSDALVSLLDLTPTLVDYSGGLDRETGRVRELQKKKWQWKTYSSDDMRFQSGGVGEMQWVPYTFHGHSFLLTLGRPNTPGWDSITASHTFHEIQMYYPMRVYRDRQYKIIWNIAYQLPYPFSSDLWTASTWQAQYSKGTSAPYGYRTVGEMIQHPKYELFDMQNDPEERNNLADDPKYANVLTSYLNKLKQFQLETGDPWALKWYYQ